MRPSAAPPEVLGASRRAWLATERQQTRMLRKLLRKVEEAPEAPAEGRSARSAPDEFLSVHSPFNLIGPSSAERVFGPAWRAFRTLS